MLFPELERHLWNTLEQGILPTCTSVARALRVPEFTLQAHFPQACFFSSFLWMRLESRCAALTQGLKKDVFFEVFLEILDQLEGKEKSIQTLFMQKTDPHFICHMEFYITKWLIRINPTIGFLERKALFLLWGWTLDTWVKDTTPDKAKTLRFVDEGLSKIFDYQTFFSHLTGFMK